MMPRPCSYVSEAEDGRSLFSSKDLAAWTWSCRRTEAIELAYGRSEGEIWKFSVKAVRGGAVEPLKTVHSAIYHISVDLWQPIEWRNGNTAAWGRTRLFTEIMFVTPSADGRLPLGVETHQHSRPSNFIMITMTAVNLIHFIALQGTWLSGSPQTMPLGTCCSSRLCGHLRGIGTRTEITAYYFDSIQYWMLEQYEFTSFYHLHWSFWIIYCRWYLHESTL